MRATTRARPRGARTSTPKPLAVELREGRRATSTLAEVLAVDTLHLLETAFPGLELTASEREVGGGGSITARMAAAAAALHRSCGLACLERLLAHPSDTVRGWAPYVVGVAPGLPLARRLELVRPSADDPHFGVREWAWLGIRAHLAADIGEAIRQLRLGRRVHARMPGMRVYGTRKANRPRESQSANHTPGHTSSKSSVSARHG